MVKKRRKRRRYKIKNILMLLLVFILIMVAINNLFKSDDTEKLNANVQNKVKVQNTYLNKVYKDELNGDIDSNLQKKIIEYMDEYFKAMTTLKDIDMTYLFDDSAFEEIVSTLHLAEGKKILVHLAYKKGRLKDFVIDVEYLAKITGNSKLLLLNPICWGINDKSCKDK